MGTKIFFLGPMVPWYDGTMVCDHFVTADFCSLSAVPERNELSPHPWSRSSSTFSSYLVQLLHLMIQLYFSLIQLDPLSFLILFLLQGDVIHVLQLLHFLHQRLRVHLFVVGNVGVELKQRFVEFGIVEIVVAVAAILQHAFRWHFVKDVV